MTELTLALCGLCALLLVGVLILLVIRTKKTEDPQTALRLTEWP